MAKQKAIWEWKIVRRAIWDSFIKLNPRKMMGNPVMFVVRPAKAEPLLPACEVNE